MATYHYQCKHCKHDFMAYQQSPDKPQKKCPECKKKGLDILIDSVPQVRDSDHYLKGGRDALVYRDLNKKHKKNASYINKQLCRDAGL